MAKNEGKLKYVVVVIALLAGIYLASATTVITDIQMTLGNVTIRPDEIQVGNSITINGTNDKITASSGKIDFDDEDLVTMGNVGIGVGEDPKYKAYVYQSSGESGATGLFAEVESPSSPSNRVYGVRGSATSTGHGYHYGVYGKAYRGSGSEAGRAYGVSGLAGNAHSGYNYGVYGQLAGTQDGAAIYGTVEGDSEVDGQWAGYFNGNVHVSDSVGIGTTNPQADLHIQDTIADIRLTSNSGNPSMIQFYDGGTGPQATIRWSPTYKALMLETSGDPVKHICLLPRNNVGIGTTNPQRALHVNDVMRLEPRSTAPSSPSEGDIYVHLDPDNSVDPSNHHIYCYLNSIWKQLDN